MSDLPAPAANGSSIKAKSKGLRSIFRSAACSPVVVKAMTRSVSSPFISSQMELSVAISPWALR